MVALARVECSHDLFPILCHVIIHYEHPGEFSSICLRMLLCFSEVNSRSILPELFNSSDIILAVVCGSPSIIVVDVLSWCSSCTNQMVGCSIGTPYPMSMH